MRVALTGGTGFTGRRVARELVARGHDVRVLVRPPAARPGVLPEAVSVVEGDLLHGPDLDMLLAGREALVHVASLAFGHAGPIVAALERHGVPRGVFFSSTAILTRLEAPSVGPRREGEERVRAARSAWTLLRPTMIYGDSGDRNLSRLIRFLAWTPIVPLPGGGRALVQPVHVDDVARAAVDALERPAAAGRCYELPGGEASPLRELVQGVSAMLGRRVALLPLPIGPMAAAAGIWGALRLPPRLTPEQVRRLAEDKAFPWDAARSDLGYAPRGWREGLAEEVRQLRREGAIR